MAIFSVSDSTNSETIDLQASIGSLTARSLKGF
jgi:hypothetical protein